MARMKCELKFKINPEPWNNLCKLRGWKHPIKEASRKMGLSMTHTSQIVGGKVHVSHDVMADYIRLAGNDINKPAEWSNLFILEEVFVREKAPSKDNYRKYNGEKPYAKYSVIGKIRVEDKAKNLERLRPKKPLPADEFYGLGKSYFHDDATPKRIQAQRRYGRR